MCTLKKRQRSTSFHLVKEASARPTFFIRCVFNCVLICFKVQCCCETLGGFVVAACWVQVTPADVSADYVLSRGITRFSHKTVRCKSLKAWESPKSHPTSPHKSPVVSAVVGWLPRVSTALTSGTLSSPHVSFVCWTCGTSKGFGH